MRSDPRSALHLVDGERRCSGPTPSPGRREHLVTGGTGTGGLLRSHEAPLDVVSLSPPH